MRCVCCNHNLNDFESTRRSATTGDFLDMCNRCYSEVAEDVPSIGRTDLMPNEYIEDEPDEVDEADTWLFDNEER